ncbi:MAG TPA: HAD-IB family hydrolase [Actinomycetota bacterium]|nr:HAD-IB family hydrolase [Actinomycetota bacterium]
MTAVMPSSFTAPGAPRCGASHPGAYTIVIMEAAFFDLDKTIIAKSSPLALGRSFFREGLIGRSFLLKSLYAQLVFALMGADDSKMERMRVEAAKLTAGWEPEKVRQVVNEVLEEVISPLIYAEALELMHDHRSAGRLVCIVSSSPEEIVEPLARMLRVNRYIATRPTVVDGKYTGDLDFYAYGPHKAEAIAALAEELGIDLASSFAYSDSVTDVPMLEVVGNPVAVNPDKGLRRIAVDRGWTIETFRNPVPLRSRLPQLRPPEVTVANGLAAAAGVAGVAAMAWWLTRRSAARAEAG